MSVVPTISILTPVWNGLPYIKECVDSVFAQEFQDWELIISDNGSTDGTRDYLDTLKDQRVRIFKQEKNLGIDGNLNFLLSKAAAPIAYCLCADDYFYPGGLGRAVNEWTIVPTGTAFIGFNWKEVVKHDISAAFSFEVLPKKMDPEMSQLAFFLFGNVVGNLSNVSFNVKILREAGGFDEKMRMAGDFEIWSRIAKTNIMVLSDTETVYVRVHDGTATSYLGKQGLLLAEQVSIYERLIADVSTYHNRQKLIDYFNIQVTSYHLRDSIKAIFYGRLANLKTFITIKSDIFWPLWKRLTLCLPLALYETGRERLLVQMGQKLINQTKHYRV